jgi:hypothetical protein
MAMTEKNAETKVDAQRGGMIAGGARLGITTR